jgi:ADP-ribosyl-[dinitrogen reductase] hydrolase
VHRDLERPFGSFGWAAAEFTDDTQMALVLAEALIGSKGYDPDVVWTWFRTWAKTARDVGNTTRASLTHADWRHVPASGRGAGNGALMRVFPVALAFLDAPVEVVRNVVLHQAALTHSDPAAGWGPGSQSK